MCRVWWDARPIPISPALNGIWVQSPHGIGCNCFCFGCFIFSVVITVKGGVVICRLKAEYFMHRIVLVTSFPWRRSSDARSLMGLGMRTPQGLQGVYTTWTYVECILILGLYWLAASSSIRPVPKHDSRQWAGEMMNHGSKITSSLFPCLFLTNMSRLGRFTDMLFLRDLSNCLRAVNDSQ